MLYQVTISRAGCVKDIVQINALDALAAINRVEANFETFTIIVSVGYREIVSVQWSGYEFEARRLDTTNGDQLPHLSTNSD